jgi:hypothetical protein
MISLVGASGDIYVSLIPGDEISRVMAACTELTPASSEHNVVDSRFIVRKSFFCEVANALREGRF